MSIKKHSIHRYFVYELQVTKELNDAVTYTAMRKLDINILKLSKKFAERQFHKNLFDSNDF